MMLTHSSSPTDSASVLSSHRAVPQPSALTGAVRGGEAVAQFITRAQDEACRLPRRGWNPYPLDLQQQGYGAAFHPDSSQHISKTDQSPGNSSWHTPAPKSPSCTDGRASSSPGLVDRQQMEQEVSTRLRRLAAMLRDRHSQSLPRPHTAAEAASEAGPGTHSQPGWALAARPLTSLSDQSNHSSRRLHQASPLRGGMGRHRGLSVSMPSFGGVSRGGVDWEAQPAVDLASPAEGASGMRDHMQRQRRSQLHNHQTDQHRDWQGQKQQQQQQGQEAPQQHMVVQVRPALLSAGDRASAPLTPSSKLHKSVSISPDLSPRLADSSERHSLSAGQSEGGGQGATPLAVGSRSHKVPRTPSRGEVYGVFKDMDRLHEGKITYSMLEDHGLRIGLKVPQARRLFQILDPSGRGYFTVKDWGSQSVAQQVSDFTRLYLRVLNNGRRVGRDEVNNASLAVRLIMAKLQLGGSSRIVCSHQLLQAFEFMDIDGSGELSRTEVEDAFLGLGIPVTQKVVTEIMEKFDRDRSGSVNYKEFVSALFPVLGSGMR